MAAAATQIVCVFNSKGGVGKTLFSMLLAGELAARESRVLVIDMDTQGDSLAWASNAPEAKPFPAKVISLAPLKANFAKVLPQHADGYDVVIIDCPPSDESSVPFAALVMANLAIIPMQPTPQEQDSILRAQTVVEQAQERNPALKVVVAFNRYDRRKSVQNIMVEKVEAALGGRVLKAKLGERTAFQEVMLYGGTIRDLAKQDVAINEVSELVTEIIKKLKVG